MTRKVEQLNAIGVSRWRREQQESLRIWAKAIVGQINGQQELPDRLGEALSDISSPPELRKIRLEQNGRVGDLERWKFLKPTYGVIDLYAEIKDSLPDLAQQIDSLALGLNFDRDLVVNAIGQTYDLFRYSDMDPAFTMSRMLRDLKVDPNAKGMLPLDNWRTVNLNRISSRDLLNDEQRGKLVEVDMGADLKYYSLIELTDINPLRNRHCYAWISTLHIPPPLTPASLFLRVLIVSSHATIGDADIKRLQEQSPLQSQS